MLVHRIKEKKVKKNTHNLLLFCAPTWPSKPFIAYAEHIFSLRKSFVPSQQVADMDNLASSEHVMFNK